MTAQKIKFLIRQRVLGFSVPDGPELDPPSSAYFLRRLQQSRFYLEYGSGGSTIAACRLRKPFVSVESDRFYLSAIKRKIADEFGAPSGHVIHADIGATLEWGYPLLRRKTSRRLERWARYATAPWALIQKDAMPDFILIDGRFRVHCALHTIKQMQGRQYDIAFDDYDTRPNYREVERFAHLHAMHGRMAVFKPRPFDAAALEASIQAFSDDYR